MKLLLLILLFPVIGFAQVRNSNSIDGVHDSIAGTSFLLKNQHIIFQKVYSSKLRQQELSDQLYALLSANNKFRFNNRIEQNDDQLVGKIFRYKVDAAKYGGTFFKTPAILDYPLNAVVIIHVKDFKYRVILSELAFKDDRPLNKSTAGNESVNKEGANKNIVYDDILMDDYFTQKRRSKFSTSKSIIKAAQYMELDLSDLFDIQKSILSNDF